MSLKTEELLGISEVEPINIIDITDPGKDLDDEQKFLLLAGLQHVGLVNLLGVVANLEPAPQRAKLAKGTLRLLGMDDVPVGIGTDCFRGGENLKYEGDVDYAKDVKPEELQHGYTLLVRLLESAADKSAVICCNSGLTDVAQLLIMEPDLVKAKVKEVVIMGGVKATCSETMRIDTVTGPDKVQYMIPDDAANNAFDWPAALYLYQSLQEHNIAMCVFMRWASYVCQFPFSLYDRFAATGNPIGASLLSRQKPAINQLWRAANAPADSPVRGRLPMSRTRQWFVEVFCKNVDPGIGPDDEVWPHVGDYRQYDPMAVAAAVPAIRAKYFEPIPVKVKDTVHHVIGPSSQTPGIKDGNELRELMTRFELTALNAKG